MLPYPALLSTTLSPPPNTKKKQKNTTTDPLVLGGSLPKEKGNETKCSGVPTGKQTMDKKWHLVSPSDPSRMVAMTFHDPIKKGDSRNWLRLEICPLSPPKEQSPHVTSLPSSLHVPKARCVAWIRRTPVSCSCTSLPGWWFQGSLYLGCLKID